MTENHANVFSSIANPRRTTLGQRSAAEVAMPVRSDQRTVQVEDDTLDA